MFTWVADWIAPRSSDSLGHLQRRRKYRPYNFEKSVENRLLYSKASNLNGMFLKVKILELFISFSWSSLIP